MLCARSSRTRSPALRSSADRSLPLLTPVAATVSETSKSIMLAPHSGQTRLRIAEIKLELVFVTTASEAIKSLPAVAVLHRQMHRTLSGAAGAFGGHWIGAAATRFGCKRRSN